MRTCAHCGRQARMLGGSYSGPQTGGRAVDLCHVSGLPDCYTEVCHGERLGWRKDPQVTAVATVSMWYFLAGDEQEARRAYRYWQDLRRPVEPVTVLSRG